MIIEAINNEWGWLGINAVELIDENEFGNLIFRSGDGAYWRIIPENPECAKIAENETEFKKLKLDNDFQFDWQMKELVSMARTAFGDLEKGRKYCLKIPAYLGGDYILNNMGEISQLEQIGFSADIARQINDLPNGTKLELKME